MSATTLFHSTAWFHEWQLFRLLFLPLCARCATGKCEACADVSWQADYYDGRRADVTCGDGCWSRMVLLGAGVN